jgi:hypothetical protein
VCGVQEAEEARRTLESQTDHEKRRAEYRDQVRALGGPLVWRDGKGKGLLVY